MDLLSHLPEHLAPRIRPISGGASDAVTRGQYVLYWMRTAVRGHENPALDTALLAARALGLPVFVYHALSERYPYASDRHHTFILEGARDVAEELARRGIGYAFHLERPGHRGSHLRTLAEGAALVITEEMPVPFVTRWTRALAGSVPTPVWAVDADLLAPLGQIPRESVDRAFRFRSATHPLRRRWLREPWPDAPAPRDGPFVPPLPFEPVALALASIAELVAACDIDHGVGPVPHSPGGSRAGYARWESFLASGLAGYHGRRNDPLQAGVSRMSPYLHYGHVSPFRLAREAAARGGKGAEKFLDELLVWRELAHAFAFHAPEPESLTALPRWARETLRAHAHDPRPHLPGWERMARARTGDPLWDAAQRSLVIHGELHNNVRMTWGKAVPGWTRSPGEALRTLFDLNHRFALDGRDPNSVGGILWCLGGLDRPFPPARPILGTVRPRSTAAHAARLDVETWARRTGRPALEDPPRVAVVGAGVAGLSAARTLADHGLEVTVLDKGRAPGGRISTREAAEGWRMDHGAQYFTARDPVFRTLVEAWAEVGVVAPWEGRLVREGEGGALEPARDGVRWVGTPGMRSVALHLARGLDVRPGHRVVRLEETPGEDGARAGAPGRWVLQVVREEAPDAPPDRLGPFDAVLLTPPPPQTAELLAGVLWRPDEHGGASEASGGASGTVSPQTSRLEGFRARLRGAHPRPCWAAMVRFRNPVPLPLDGAFLKGPVLSWIARDSSKPGRATPEGGENWVLHGAPGWSEAWLERGPDEVAAALVAAFRELADRWGQGRTPEPETVRVHRWRYALPDPALPERALWDPALGIGVAGDALGGPRVEGAFLSGRALAGRLLGAPPPVPGDRRGVGGAPYPRPGEVQPGRTGDGGQLDLLDP
jgi:photolyase PhrII